MGRNRSTAAGCDRDVIDLDERGKSKKEYRTLYGDVRSGYSLEVANLRADTSPRASTGHSVYQSMVQTLDGVFLFFFFVVVFLGVTRPLRRGTVATVVVGVADRARTGDQVEY